MKAPRWTTICALRGEIGLSSMKDRINRSRMQYIRNKTKGRERADKNSAKRIRG